ncbi:MAG: restriction endonuclease subunit S, partial [Leptospirales bacterium]
MDVITKHLDIWSSAQAPKKSVGRGSSKKKTAYGIKKLRELILDLAVRGKLVPQDAKDEPASELLKKIEEEKERLIAEGKIKKQKPLPVITEEEKPFALPKGWEWVRLGDISANIHYGYTASADHQSKDVRMLRITDIQNDSVNWETVPGCAIHNENISDYQLENDDILIARTGGTIGKSYLVANINVCSVFASYLIRVQHLKTLYQEFIKVYLGSQIYWKQLYAKSMGTGQPNVNGNALKNLVVPLPPLAEQKRIVAKVDELMALCDKLEEEQTDSVAAHETLVEHLLGTLTCQPCNTLPGKVETAKEFQSGWKRIAKNFDTLFTTEHSIDQLKQTILQLAVMGKLVAQDVSDEPASELLAKIEEEKKRLIEEGKIKKQKPLPAISEEEKPFELPTEWEIARLGKFTVVGTGTTPAREKPSYYSPQDINWVTSGETRNDFITETNEMISTLAAKETNISVYPIGTLIVAMYGQGKTRGQVSELMIEAGTNQACAAVSMLNKNVAHRKYLKLFFKKAYDELRSHAAGGAQPNLNLGKVANTVIPLPP